jgi:proline iminopeptidase
MRPHLLAGAAALLAAYRWGLLPRLRTWGATPEEVRAAYPGDDLVPGGRRGATMATTIPAPPRDVWPWLVQMGADRGGFYSFDRLDNGGRPSAERIHPQWQDLREGDRMAVVPDGSHWFDVARLDPERALVLRASLALPSGRCFDPEGPLPRAFTDGTWGFFLSPTAEGHTRLVVTGRSRERPRAPVRAVNAVSWEPAHWIMQLRQFAGLRRRATVPPAAPEGVRRSTEASSGPRPVAAGPDRT